MHLFVLYNRSKMKNILRAVFEKSPKRHFDTNLLSLFSIYCICILSYQCKTLEKFSSSHLRRKAESGRGISVAAHFLVEKASLYDLRLSATFKIPCTSNYTLSLFVNTFNIDWNWSARILIARAEQPATIEGL